jgi:hypothetical protein
MMPAHSPPPCRIILAPAAPLSLLVVHTSQIDTHTGDVLTWHQPGAAPGEPCFIPKPGASR